MKKLNKLLKLSVMVAALAPAFSYAHGMTVQSSGSFQLQNSLQALPANGHYKVLIQTNIEPIKNHTPKITTTLMVNGKKVPLTTTGKLSAFAHKFKNTMLGHQDYYGSLVQCSKGLPINKVFTLEISRDVNTSLTPYKFSKGGLNFELQGGDNSKPTEQQMKEWDKYRSPIINFINCTMPMVKPYQKAYLYLVKKGDSLWSIADEIYGNGELYKKIYSANKSMFKNNKMLQAGEVLSIPAK